LQYEEELTYEAHRYILTQIS